MNSTGLARWVPRPPADAVNSGRSPLPQALMLERFGPPCGELSDRCAPPTNRRLTQKLVTRSVGPFRVTGHVLAVESLVRVMADIRSADPALYGSLGTSGMLCCRRVRGGTGWSNHSWGFAVDLTVEGELDVRGDGKVQAGLMRAYPHFHRHGWFWGTEFRTEDAMHFEISQETMLGWIREGRA